MSRVSPGDNNTAEPPDYADQLSAQLIRLLRVVSRSKSQVTKYGPEGLERLAYVVLFCLIHEGPQRTGKVAENLHTEISAISRQAKSLVAHGLVERRADPIDGRASVLAATPEGERVFEENRRLRNLWMAGILAEWPDEQRSQLITLLDRFCSGIEASASGNTTANQGIKL